MFTMHEWHIDGLCINGCICGFTRKIIWLNVYQTNNDPKIIGGYFLDAKGNGGCPTKIRTYYVTELDMTVRRRYFFCGSLSYKCLLCFRARLFFLWLVGNG